MKGKPDKAMSEKYHKLYRSRVGKLLHLVNWSRSECLNRSRELSRFVGEVTYGHIVTMLCTIKYCVIKAKLGLTLRTSTKCNDDRNLGFFICGKYDSDYSECSDTRKSVSGYSTCLRDSVVMVKIVLKIIVALSLIEAEILSETQCTQDMLYVYILLKNIVLKLKFPMIIEVDYQGAVDLKKKLECCSNNTTC